MKKQKVFPLVLCALFAALSAVLSQISFPIGPVPIALTHLSVFLAAGLLGAFYGAVSQTVFVLLGAMGVPVFAGFTGGMARVLGPTGGFIIGYIVCAALTGFILDRFGRTWPALFSAMLAGMAVSYLLGVVWFMFAMQADLNSALAACVYPFLPGDALKMILSAVLIKRLHPLLTSLGGGAIVKKVS